MSILLPPYLYPDDESVEVVDRTSTKFRPEFASGVVQRQEQASPILRVTQKYTGMATSDRGVLLSFLRQCRGIVNTIYLTPLRYALRGAFPGTELLKNNTFQNGTTGWGSGASNTISVSDRVLRSVRAAINGINNSYALSSATVTGVQYAPYAYRAMLLPGRGSFLGSGLYVGDGNIVASLGGPFYPGVLATVVYTPTTTSLQHAILDNAVSGVSPGDYINIPYVSLSRCALVDNGQNLLLRSDQFDNASWAKSDTTITADFAAAHDGTAIADRLVETATTNQHFVKQTITGSSAATDYALMCAMKADGRSFGWLGLSEGSGSTETYQLFNLATGTVGTTTATGANWANLRAFNPVSLGNGWYLCCIVARKANAATSITANVGLSSTDSRGSYAGSASATGTIQILRATLAASSVPSQLVQTTSAATSGSNQTGSAIYIKGLSVSTNGLLLMGDFFEINGELKQVTASLNSDAAGIGYLQFEPPLFRSPADNDPVIINNPMGKFILGDNGKAENRLGRYADVDLTFEEIYE